MAEKFNLKKCETLCKAALLGAFVLFLSVYWVPQVWAAPLPLDQQEFAAVEHRFAITRTTDISEREALHLRIIAESPSTELAEESHWLLSNLYLDDFDEPRYDQAREILELFLQRYPSSRWVTHVESRLAWLRGEVRPVP